MTAWAILPWKNVETAQFTMEPAETYLDGAILLQNSGENVEEVAADPTAILGVAMGAAGDHVDPLLQLVALATEAAQFICSGDNDPTKADINQDFGAVADGDGVWTLDGTETSAKVFQIIDVDLIRNLYIVRFLTGVLQTAP